MAKRRLTAKTLTLLSGLLAVSASATSSLAAGEHPDPSSRSEAARAARIEKGLLPPILLRGRATEPMALADRLDHYGASALSLAVIDGYEVVWARAWGTVALDREQAVTPESLFQAGSVSKPVTAVVAAALAGKGGLSLDTEVGSLLDRYPEIRGALGHQVSLRQLLSHTAAIPSHSWRGWYRDERLPSTAEMLSEAELTTATLPGREVRYSNAGYLLAQLALEEATGRPFARLAAESLFAPLGLERTSFEEPLPQKLWDAAVWGHYRGEEIRGKGRMYPAAPAGLWTTPSELARITGEVMRAAAGRGDALLTPAAAQQMLSPALPGADRSLGWSVTAEGAEVRIFQEGRVAGFTAFVVGFPERGQGLVIMSNSHRSHPLGLEVARAVAAEYGWPGFVEEREVVPLTEEQLRRFEGRFAYETAPGTVISFTVRDGQLSGRTAENVPWDVVPIGDREFLTTTGSALIRFDVDTTGRVTGFQIGIPGGTSAQVNRVEDESPSPEGASQDGGGDRPD